jgi:glycosyltransferase involved in cell wall biosynthesis
MKLISIVIPIYNESLLLNELLQRLDSVRTQFGEDYHSEVIMVDDGSTDDSLQILHNAAMSQANIRVVALSRNFGHQSALLAGISVARGDAVIVMDADLQDPPELLPELITAWHGGSEVVYAKRRTRAGESVLKKITANIFYRVIDWLSDTKLPRNVGDFRIMDRVVVDHLLAMKEKSLYLRGMVTWLGYTQSEVLFDRDQRFAGTTKYSLKKMLGLASDALLSFSDKPLRIITRIGAMITLSAFILGLYLLTSMILFEDNSSSGWLSLILAVIFFSGVQLVSLGIIGQYLSRIYKETKERPLYLINQKSSRNI